MKIEVNGEERYVFLEFITKISAVNEVEQQRCLNKEVSIRVGVGQWVVEAIGISVEVLAEVGHLDVVVRAEHAGGERVVQAPVHVDQTYLSDVLVSSKTSIKHEAISVWTEAPCIEMVFLYDITLVI